MPPAICRYEAERSSITIVLVRVNSRDDDYLDRITLLAARAVRPPAKAARRAPQPPPGDFRRAYELVLSHCEHIVVDRAVQPATTPSSCAGRRARGGGARIQVLDTLNASAGLGLVAMAAAEVAQTGAEPAAWRRRGRCSARAPLR
ncbi:MAG: DegV family protein [Lysobacterales bacterium]